MKLLTGLACLLLFGAVVCEDMEESVRQPKMINSPMSVRYLPADVLRDAPARCFQAHTCLSFAPGQQWMLAQPFCGNVTCVAGPIDSRTGLPSVMLEKVEDCGGSPFVRPAPKDANHKPCRVVNEGFNPQAVYPACCPLYACDEGYSIEFSEPEQFAQSSLKSQIPIFQHGSGQVDFQQPQ